ncbi:MAG: hypothetical protein IKH54_01985 [Bacilli bacterium]|nr:hypothetical protein [Bacilli bacterium]
MKKFFPVLIAIALLTLTYQVIVNFFISSHNMSYSILNDKTSFLVKEDYKKSSEYDDYNFFVNDSNGKLYIFSSDLNYNKQRKVLSDIAYYSDDNISCILPIYKKNNYGNVVCNYNGKQVDYSYLVTNKYDTKKIDEKFLSVGYKKDKRINYNITTSEYNGKKSIFTIYDENILDNYTFAIWNYDGVLLINNKKKETRDYYTNDVYNNSFSTIVGKYYLVINFRSITEKLYDINYVNLEDYGKNSFFIKAGINSDMYINGIYDNKLYLTDLKDKKQIILNPYKENFEIIEGESLYKYYDGEKMTDLSKKDFFSDKKVFDNYQVRKITDSFGNVDIKKYGNFYYFSKDGVFYKVHESNLNYPIKLFKFDNVVEWKLEKGDIGFVSDDTYYLYSESEGIKPILKNNELRFNYENICNVYKKL